MLTYYYDSSSVFHVSHIIAVFMVKRKGKWYTSGKEEQVMEILTAVWNVIAEAAGFWMDHLIFINILLSVVIVFFERRDPKTVSESFCIS